MEQKSFLDRMQDWVKNSVTLKLVTIGFLLLIMLIPLELVEDLIRERVYYQQDVIRSISEEWGYDQLVNGPVLTVPYLEVRTVVDTESPKNFEVVRKKRYAHFLPHALSYEGSMEPVRKHRGIYETYVYASALHCEGKFDRPDLSNWQMDDEQILWDEAFVSIGISDMRGVQERIQLSWNDTSAYFKPGVENSCLYQGVHVPIVIDDADAFNFSFDLILNGNRNLSFVPLAEETNIHLTSSWQHPSFNGAFLPDMKQLYPEVEGFEASWKVLHLNRSIPQSFANEKLEINGSSFGVDLFMPVDQYTKTARSAKYAVLFIALTFMVFFFIQVINKVRVHALQYLIVGLALTLFFVLLLSLSEHIGFDAAYFVAALGIVLEISLYVKSVFKHRKYGLVMFAILSGIYGFIYTIIQMEDFSLLMGSIGLFIVLGIMMYLSRKVDWSNLNRK